MACVLQIGAGGVGSVVAHKMAMNRAIESSNKEDLAKGNLAKKNQIDNKNEATFSRIILASRTLSKCKSIADSIRKRGLGEIEIESVDADDIEALVTLIQRYKPKIVINVALPYQDLNIMEACLRTKTHYLDTANYEHPSVAHFEYKEQWAYDMAYKKAGIFALLGSGFDPGVTNVFCAYAQKHYFDTIESIDILDCNAGDHGYAFATNFNPEINLREVSSKARYWIKEWATPSLDLKDSITLESNLKINPDLQEDRIYRKFERSEKHFKIESMESKELKNEDYCGGQWRDVEALRLMKEWEYNGVGVKNSYLLYHEELESLIRNIKGLRRIRFFMTFGESYLTHMKVLENVGLLRIDEVAHKGSKIVPLEVLKTLLPDPATLAPRTKGKTHIGCFIHGIKDGKKRNIYIYNICDHQACFNEVGAQGVSYTTGVPAMIGAKLILEGKWGVGCEKILSLADNYDMPKGGEMQGVSLRWDSLESNFVSNPTAYLNAGAGVWNMEQNDPDPFMAELNKQGLPYVVAELIATEGYRILEDGMEQE